MKRRHNVNEMKKIVVAVIMTFSCLLTMSGCGMLSLVNSGIREGINEAVNESINEVVSEAVQEAINESLEEQKEGNSFLDDAIREERQPIGDGNDTVTVLCYFNGSDLETESSEATGDICEILNAGYSDKVNVLIQTMGTRSWDPYLGIASNRSQTYQVSSDGMKLVRDDLGQLDCTDPETLEDFVKWGAANYPADRYILLFWNHGGGPVYGFGYDEFQDEEASMSMAEMKSALKDAGVFFDIIGMDCCIMSSLETCLALYDFCDYAVLSEDFESGLGWSYTEWMKNLYQNPSISSLELGTQMADTMVRANETERYGDDSIMAVIDESMMKVLYNTWTDFAYSNEEELLSKNYSQLIESDGRTAPHALGKKPGGFFSDWIYEDEEYYLSDYYVTDIMAVASMIESEKSDALKSALSNAIAYMRCTNGDSHLTGLAVTLPYGDYEFYNTLQDVFLDIGIDKEYVNWLSNFASASGYNSFFDYGGWNDYWDGWDEYEDSYDWGYWNPEENFGGWSDSWGWDDWCPDGNCYDCPDGDCYDCPDGDCYDCPDGNCYDCPDGNCYDCPNGNCYDCPDGNCYDCPYGDCYDCPYGDCYDCPNGECYDYSYDCPDGDCYDYEEDYEEFYDWFMEEFGDWDY